MSNRKWNKGKPPHVGWWNANVMQSSELWRYWDGSGFWSQPVNSKDDLSEVESQAYQKVSGNDGIKWCHYWPENARVPRINPNKEK